MVCFETLPEAETLPPEVVGRVVKGPFFKFERLGTNRDHIHISAQRKFVYGDGLF